MEVLFELNFITLTWRTFKPLDSLYKAGYKLTNHVDTNADSDLLHTFQALFDLAWLFMYLWFTPTVVSFKRDKSYPLAIQHRWRMRLSKSPPPRWFAWCDHIFFHDDYSLQVALMLWNLCFWSISNASNRFQRLSRRHLTVWRNLIRHEVWKHLLKRQAKNKFKLKAIFDFDSAIFFKLLTSFLSGFEIPVD